MNSYLNIKNVNEFLKEKKVKLSTVENYLFDFTVDFYHAMSLMKDDQKTTKEYIIYLLSRCAMNIACGLNLKDSVEAQDDLDKAIEGCNKLIDLTDKEKRNYFIQSFNTEVDNTGAIIKLASLICIISQLYPFEEKDILNCLETMKF